ncbi:hypothetical protein M747DRAFT_238647 [Aspergillus niger ATCC 13496]|uniref:Uncharacterized protein n=1 Tax=Aspergillus niger ATCC 13496 TaxID=1353008 RepID=A0A370BWA7_ASPNG|nr:hypothetical protein M747DRAFT_238647 [Aspergillus niger ATCC 13496]
MSVRKREMQVSDVKPTSRPFSSQHSSRRNSFPPISADPFNDPTKDRIIKLESPIRSQEKVTLVIFPEKKGRQTNIFCSIYFIPVLNGMLVERAPTLCTLECDISQIRLLLLNQFAMDAIQQFLYVFPEPAPHKGTEPVEELCLGLPRTGIESLSVGLQKLGLDTYHGWDLVFEPHGRKLQCCHELVKRNHHAPELLVAYPGAKVILNGRRDVSQIVRVSPYALVLRALISIVSIAYTCPVTSPTGMYPNVEPQNFEDWDQGNFQGCGNCAGVEPEHPSVDLCIIVFYFSTYLAFVGDIAITTIPYGPGPFGALLLSHPSEFTAESIFELDHPKSCHLCRLSPAMPTPEDIDQWLEETFIVHPEAEYNVTSAEKLALSLPPSPFFKLHWVPASRELIFRTPHWRTDGAGLMMLQDAFLTLLSSPAEEINFDGSEISRLPPTMNELFCSGFEATEETKKAFDGEWQAVFDPSLKPLSWVKHALPGTIPGSTVRLSHKFSKDETKQLITEIKKRGITVTNGMASAFMVTAANHATPADGRFILLNPFNVRRYLPAPWNGTAGAGATYHTGRLQSFNLEDGKDYESACRAVTEFYNRGIKDAFSFMPLLIQAATSLVDTPAEVANSGNGSASVDLSQLGLVDDLLQTRYEGPRYTLEIEDWWTGVEFVTKKLQGYTWTRDVNVKAVYIALDSLFNFAMQISYMLEAQARPGRGESSHMTKAVSCDPLLRTSLEFKAER